MASILIIDDERAIRNVLKDILNNEGYTSDEATDGEEGLKKFKLANFDLVLCDIKMPKIDGIEFLQKAKEILQQVELADWFEYIPTELSSGQQQRISLARALINNPKIILADEPTGNLDTKSGRDVMNIIEELNKQGKTIVLITHEEDIAKYAKRIIHMRDGKIETDITK